MFWQMVKGALIRQRGRFILIALTVALGVSLATAMLNVMFDIGEKVNQELKAFGANIVVTPRNSMVLKDLYGVETTKSMHREYLEEADLGNIKTIFWTNNIVAFAPSLTTNVTLADGDTVPLFGTWFEHTLTLPTDETYTTGVKFMKSWWHVDGEWADDTREDEVLVGTKLAQKLGVSAGSTIPYKKADGSDGTLRVTGIVSGGGEEENQLVGSLLLAQSLANAADKIDQVEVSAVTTPENDLARKAAENPKSLSQAEYDIWYCTAYVGSIAYQIEEVMQNAAAHPVRQIAESEGKILDKTFNSDTKVDTATIARRDMQYLYLDGEDYVFMDNTTYDQVHISADVVGEARFYLLDNQSATVAMHEGIPLFIELPASVELEITYTEPGLQGDRSTGGTKPATLETGKEIQVPLFITTGEKIKVDTRDGSYISRVNG